MGRHLLLAALAISSVAVAASPDGAALYKQRCAACHDHPSDRVPSRDVLAKRAPEDVMKALTVGAMKEQGAGLSNDEMRSLAVLLTGKEPGTSAEPAADANLCAANAIGSFAMGGPEWNGWGRDVENSRYQPKPGLKSDEVPKLKVKWTFAYPGKLTYGQPTIMGGRVFVTTDAGKIYSLDARTGCTIWTIDVHSGVRTAISIGAMPKASKSKYAAYFGDEHTIVHAVDAATGAELWQTKLDEHPLARIAGSPVLYKDRIYVPLSSWEEGVAMNLKYECCKFRGSVAALDAYSGKLLWKTYSITDPPKPFKKNSVGTDMYGPAGAAIWSAPTLDVKRKVVYAGTGNSYTDVETNTANAILAIDAETGSLKWANQVTAHDNFLVGCYMPGAGNCPKPVGPDVDFGSSPILRTLPNGKQVILAGQKSGMLYALDPDQRGKTLWEKKIGEGSALGGIEWGPAADDENVYVAISDVIPKAGKQPGGITALKIATGEEVWHTPAPKPVCTWGRKGCNSAQSAAVTAIPGVVFSGSLDGHLRGYSTKDGAIVWDFDTGQPFETVNHVKATGGSIDAAGPTVANGMLYVNSGYGRFVGQPGNVLIAFSVDGN